MTMRVDRLAMLLALSLLGHLPACGDDAPPTDKEGTYEAGVAFVNGDVCDGHIEGLDCVPGG
jgi:hypothetical protein